MGDLPSSPAPTPVVDPALQLNCNDCSFTPWRCDCEVGANCIYRGSGLCDCGLGNNNFDDFFCRCDTFAIFGPCEPRDDIQAPTVRQVLTDAGVVGSNLPALEQAVARGDIIIDTIDEPLLSDMTTFGELTSDLQPRMGERSCTMRAGPGLATNVEILVSYENGEESRFGCDTDDADGCYRSWWCDSNYCAVQCEGSRRQVRFVALNAVDCEISGTVVSPLNAGQCFNDNSICSICTAV